MANRFCHACGRQITRRAAFCPECGTSLAGGASGGYEYERPPVVVYRQPLWSPGLAAVLSFFIPGLGQLYKRQLLASLGWFIFVPVGYYFFFLPGLILHVCCIISAISGDPTIDREV
jgi:hypothetical protein